MTQRVGWERTTWSAVADLHYGKALRGYHEGSGEVRVFGTNGPVGFTDKPQASGPGVIIGRKGAYRGVHFSPGDFWVIDTAFYLKPKRPLDMRWAYYALQLADINGLDSGSAIPSTTRESFGSLSALIPTLHDQHAIAAILGALDDKIAANTALSSTADQFIQSAFQQALEFGTRSVGLLEEFDVRFGEPFVGAQFSAPSTGRPLIRIRDLKTFQSQIWTTEHRERETVIYPGDVVVGMDAEFRATAWEGQPGLLNQRLCRFSHRTFGSALIREAIKQPLAEVEGEKAATTVIHLNKSDLARKTATIPSDGAALDFETIAEPLYASRIALAQENRTLAETRNALLPQLMSGKLHVRDAERVAVHVGI